MGGFVTSELPAAIPRKAEGGRCRGAAAPPPPAFARCSRLCVVQGMLLDCDTATLTVWVNGERKGVMVRPGMTDPLEVPRLEGPLRWAVDVGTSSSAAIEGPLPLPE